MGAIDDYKWRCDRMLNELAEDLSDLLRIPCSITVESLAFGGGAVRLPFLRRVRNHVGFEIYNLARMFRR